MWATNTFWAPKTRMSWLFFFSPFLFCCCCKFLLLFSGPLRIFVLVKCKQNWKWTKQHTTLYKTNNMEFNKKLGAKLSIIPFIFLFGLFFARTPRIYYVYVDVLVKRYGRKRRLKLLRSTFSFKGSWCDCVRGKDFLFLSLHFHFGMADIYTISFNIHLSIYGNNLQ